MLRGAHVGVLAAALVAVAGCGGGGTPTPAPTSSSPAAPQAPGGRAVVPPVDPGTTGSEPRSAAGLVPEGVPTTSTGAAADPAQLAVVQRWLATLAQGDVPAAADAFADGAVVANGAPPTRLANRAQRIAFNVSFPCGAEVEEASSVRGYLIVVYRLTDRRGSPCDGPGGTAMGVIKVSGGRMTEWYRLPNPPQRRPDGPAPVV